MRAYEFMAEMAIPREVDRLKNYWHGTDNETAARAIFVNGLDPAATEVKYGSSRPVLRPMNNHVYITPKLSYAMIYALGGDMFGHDYAIKDIKTKGEFGFVFRIDGQTLADIGPDEDSIGEMIHHIYERKPQNPVEYQLIWLAERHATPASMVKLKRGEYSAYAAVGKKLTKYMSDELKLAVIDAGAHIAHNGRLPVAECFAFSRKDASKIARDGSNFFEYAKPWQP